MSESETLFLGELKELLLELAEKIQAEETYVSKELFAAEYKDESEDGNGKMRLPLGSGAFLRIELGRRPDHETREAIERSIRAIRTAARRWSIDIIPVCNPPLKTWQQTAKETILKRVLEFLQALNASPNACNALIVRSGDILQTAVPLDERHKARLPFVLQQLETAKKDNKGVTSHPSVHAEDVFAARFWYDCSIIVFFDGEFSLDFVRHRVLLAVRELSKIMPNLDDPPPAPAKIAPVPE